jgi:hypothetical protein
MIGRTVDSLDAMNQTVRRNRAGGWVVVLVAG